MKYLKILFFLTFLLSAQLVNAQNWRLVMDIAVTEDGKKMPGAEIKLFKNGKLSETLKTDNKGTIDVPLLPDAVYIISISGPGYIDKKLEIDTRNVNPEDMGSGDIFYPAEVDIFKKIEGLNLDILDEPIGKIWYDDKFGGFTYNKDYTLQRQAALSALKESYLKKKEEEKNKLLKSKELYAEAIKKGDKAFKEENWEVAKAEYEKAQTLDPFETYPTDQLGAIATKLVKRSADEENYKAAIMKGDAALKGKNYKDAISEYQKAISYKPTDQYAIDKLAEAQTLAVNMAKLEQDYLSAIEKGDNFLISNKLNEAKVAFEEAQQLKPTESYPKNKLGEINSILAKSNQVETDFQDAIKAGDAALAQSDLPTAKASYEKAMGLKPSESYPKAQLEKIDQLLAEAAKKEQSYITAVEEADNLLKTKDYEGAKKSYELALQIKPSELYPKNKIKEISDYLAENAMKEKEYVAAISAADAALASQKYSDAKSNYQKAQSLKTNESYPKEKIAEIDKILLEQKEMEGKYLAAIASADKAFSEKNFESAKASYSEAQTLKPAESYPKEKLVEIKKMETELATIEKDYAAAIQMADAALTAKKYEEASTYYQQALSYKANESYPKEKLLEVETQLAAAKKAEYDYNLAIEAGDKAFSANKYELAKSEYNRALSLKPNEAYASDKLAAIEKVLTEYQAQEQQYNDAISAADEAFTAKSWTTAEKHYLAASKIKVNESYPKQQLEEISSILAEQTAKENKYKEVLASADQAFAAKNYEQARKSYEAALDLKANENYPSEKIAEIAQLLTKQAEEKEAIRLENERKAKLEQDYIAAITEGDKQFEAKAYEQSRAKYEEALSLKPDESYASKRIAEIEGLRQKELANMKEAELDASYEVAIGTADAAFSAKDYNLAKSSYKEALAIKANETYPLEKLEEIKLAEKQLALEQEKKAEAEKTAQLQSQYDAAILKADKAFANSNFELATASYQSALNLKPNESYPQEKMEEISSKISELEENAVAEKLAREKAAKLETSYLAAIATADEALKNEDLSTAKNSYNKALELKPNENYPKQKLQEIASFLEEQAAKDSERAAALAAEKAKIENEYNTLLASADKKLANQAYREAITDYQAAIKVKPSESYPREKVDEINTLLTEQKAKEEALLQQNEKMAELKKAYDKAIIEADGFFEAKDWENAKAAYYNAAKLQPSNEYPHKQLQVVQSNILEKQEALSKAANRQKEVEKELMYATLVKNADLSFESADYELAKRDYEEALSIKPNESYPQERLLLINKKMDEAVFLAEQNQVIKAEEKEGEIIVQSGERSSINNDTEERIDQIYKEMWGEKKVGKESYFSEREEQQKKKAEELKKLEEENKLNAIERLEDISISYEKTMEQSTKLNTQNHQNVQNVQKRLNTANQNLEHNSKREREHFYSDQQDLQNNINKSNEQLAEKQKRLNYYEDANDAQTAFHKDKSEEHQQVQTAAALRIKSIQNYKDKQVSEHQESIINKAGQLTERKVEIQNLEEERKSASEERILSASGKEYTYEKRFVEDQKLAQDNSMEQIREQEEYFQQKQAAQAEVIISRSESLVSRKAELQEMEEKRKMAAGERIQTAAAKEYNYENRFVENQQQFQDKSMEQIEAQQEYFRQKAASQTEAVKIRSERLADRKSELQEMEERRKSTAEARAQNAVLTDYATFDKNYEQNQKQAQATAVSLIEQQNQLQQDRQAKQQEVVKRKSELLNERKKELHDMEVQRRNAAEQRASQAKQADFSVNDEKFISNQEKVQSDNVSRIEAMENRKKEVENTHLRSISEKAERLDQRKSELLEMEQKRRQSSERMRTNNSNTDYYQGGNNVREDEESSKYPQGISEQVIENKNNSTTIRRIVVNGTQVDIYEKTLHAWGGVFFTKNGNNITEDAWDRQTSP